MHIHIPEDKESEKERNFKLFASTRSHQDSNLGQQHFIKATNTIFALNGGAAVAMLALYGNLHDKFIILFSIVFSLGEIVYLAGAIFAARSIMFFENSISIWATIWENAALKCNNKEEMYSKKMQFEGKEHEGSYLASLSGEHVGNAILNYKRSFKAFLLATFMVSAAFLSIGLIETEKTSVNPVADQPVTN